MSVEISQFSNGLTVVTDPMANLESAALGVWVGTATRSARQIAEEIEAVGGFLNAYTSREQTAFHARVLKADVALGLDIIADILINPSYEPAELERERQVVLQELGQARDTPDDIVFDHLQTVIYPGQALGWPILGNEATVGSFTPAHLREYAGARYRAKNMVLVSSGAVAHDAMVRMVQDKFARLTLGDAAATPPAHYVGGDFREIDDLEQAHIVYGFPGLPANDPDFYVAQVYATVLGGGMSSRLFQEVREKRGLCYSIYAFSSNFHDDGFTGIYVGTGEKEAGEVSAVIAGEMEAMTGPLGEAEIARARAQLKSGLLMGLERPGSRAEQIAGQIFTLGRIQPAAEIVAQIDAVDGAAIKRFADATMRDPSIAALGPVARLESHDTFSTRFGRGLRAAE